MWFTEGSFEVTTTYKNYQSVGRQSHYIVAYKNNNVTFAVLGPSIAASLTSCWSHCDTSDNVYVSPWEFYIHFVFNIIVTLAFKSQSNYDVTFL